MSSFQTNALIQLIRQSDTLLQARRERAVQRVRPEERRAVGEPKKRNLLEVHFFVDLRFRRLELDTLLKDHDDLHC